MHPKYLFFGNGRVAASFLERQASIGAESWPPLLVVLNVRDRQRDIEAARDLAERHSVPILEWGAGAAERVEEVLSRNPDSWILSVYFGHILPDGVLNSAGGRAVNLHPSLLPWCRGANTNVWPLLEGSPAGVTLQAMTSEVDRGPILAQREIEVRSIDTGVTMFERLEEAGIELLMQYWPAGVLDAWPGTKQPPDSGSFHATVEFERGRTIEMSESDPAWPFWVRLRAFTFPPYGGLRMRLGDRVIEARLELTEIDVVSKDD